MLSSSIRMNSKPSPSTEGVDTLPPSLSSLNLGMWRIIYDTPVRFGHSWAKSLQDWKSALLDKHLLRLVRDIFQLGPILFIFCVFSRFVRGFEDALTIYLSNNLLQMIESGLSSGFPNRYEICWALAARSLLSAFLIAWRNFTSRLDPIMATRVKLYFEERMMEAHADMDGISNDHSISDQPPCAWGTLYTVLETVDMIVSTWSQLLLIASVAHTQEDGWLIIFICMAKPLIDTFLRQDLMSRPYVAHVTNTTYLRMRALYSIMTDPAYKKEIFANVLGPYFVEEYRHARSALGDVSDEIPYRELSNNQGITLSMLTESINNLPIIFVASKTLWDPRHVSLSSLTMIEQTTFSLRFAIDRLKIGMNNLYHSLESVRSLYARIDAHEERVKAQAKKNPYPPPSKADQRGMEIEFKDVYFAYPGGPADRFALQGLNFTIKPSSLVVIVGENGSGKSSVVNLLEGFYSPSRGSIFVDGAPAESFRSADRRAATALLTQEHRILPLTVAENIGLGDPDDAGNVHRVIESAQAGGAADCILRLPQKYDEILEPLHSVTTSGYLQDGPLKAIRDKLEHSTGISGGEKQRLAASRTFNRLLSNKIKLVVVDEPSSAIDPQGEFELFEMLRASQHDRTMVFVTHRFGHLTKYADVILCMHDGRLVEIGTHQQLLRAGGHYANLYNVQAHAFD